MNIVTTLAAFSLLVLVDTANAANTCNAGQINSSYGPAASNGFVQASPLIYPTNTGDVSTDGEGIAFDSSDNMYVQVLVGGAPGTLGVVGVQRISSSGVIDRGYGGFGFVVPSNQSPSGGSSWLTIDNQGRLVFVTVASGALVAARFLDDGSADATFGTMGSVSLPLASNPNVSGAATQADGKILIGARVNQPGGQSNQAAVVRLNANGSFDTTFGSNGIAFIAPAGFAGIGRTSGVAVLPDGRVVAIGTLYGNDGTIEPYAARLLPSGVLDTSFGSGGVSAFNFGIVTYGRRFGIQSDGKIVIGAGAVDGNGVSTISVERVDTNGALDTTFGANGRASVAPGFLAYTMTLQSNGRVLVAGADSTTGQTAYARLTAKGQLDATFGTGGISIISPSGATSSGSSTIGVNSNGKIVSIIGAQYAAGYTTALAVSLCH